MFRRLMIPVSVAFGFVSAWPAHAQDYRRNVDRYYANGGNYGTARSYAGFGGGYGNAGLYNRFGAWEYHAPFRPIYSGAAGFYRYGYGDGGRVNYSFSPPGGSEWYRR
jgi:hypothetical protein